MTPKQVALVQQSWSAIAPAADRFSTLFLQRLDKTAPELTAKLQLSPESTAPQVFALLDTAIATLDLTENLAPALTALGRRLAAEGWTQNQLKLARDALLWTIVQALGATSPETRQAWQLAIESLYGLIHESTPDTQPSPCIARRGGLAANRWEYH